MPDDPTPGDPTPDAGIDGDGRVIASEQAELVELRERLREAEETLRMIRHGDVDALLIGPPDSEQVYTLSTADQPYRLIVAGMGEGAATVAESGTIVYANARLSEIVGRPTSRLMGTAVLDLAADREALAAVLDVRSGGIARTQLALRRSDGTEVPVAISVSGLNIDSTSFVRCVILTDLTTIKQTERELSWSHAALRKRDAFLEKASQIVGLGTWETSSDMTYQAIWSDNVYAITGRTRKGPDQREESLLSLVHPDDRGQVREAFADALAGRRPLRVKHRIVRPDGQVRWVRQAAVVEHEAGAPRRILGVIQDITAEVAAAELARHQAVELERRVAQRTAALTAANRDLEIFTYTASHDLRAPLRAVNSFSRALLEECADVLGETGHFYATRVLANGEHLASLLEGLLQLSRVSRAPMRTTLIDLSEIADGMLADMGQREPLRRVAVTVQEGVRARGDPALIRSVLQNLLDNAWRFTSRREAAAIEFGSMPAAGSAVGCYVRDNGAGFDPAHADRLFQPFRRLHSDEQFSGTGLGLASARRIVERHGGQIWAEGEPDAGATFFFTLDGAHVTDPEDGPAGEPAESGGDEAATVAATRAAIENRLDELAPPGEAGAQELRSELIDAFRTVVPEHLARLDDAADLAALDLVGNEAHHIRGAAGTVGAANLARLCGELEQLAGSGEPADLADLLAAVRREARVAQLALGRIPPTQA